MQQHNRKMSFFKTLVSVKRLAANEPKKSLQPLSERQLYLVAGGASLPRGGW